MSDLKPGRSHKKDRDSISGSPNPATVRKIITTDVDVVQLKSFPVNSSNYKIVKRLFQSLDIYRKIYYNSFNVKAIIPVGSFLFKAVAELWGVIILDKRLLMANVLPRPLTNI